MIGRLSRTAAALLVCALAGAVFLILAFNRHPDLVFEMDRDMPRTVASGFYPAERHRDYTFVWTSRHAEVSLPGIDRSASWACTVRFRGMAPEGSSLPTVHIGVDGITMASRGASAEQQDVTVTAPPRPNRPDLVLNVTTSTTFVPGPSDRRELGVQVDRLACQPTGRATMPPRAAIEAASAGAAALGAAFMLSGMTFASAMVPAALVVAGGAALLSRGPAPYSGFSRIFVRFALWTAALTFLAVMLLDTMAPRGLAPAARFVIASTGVMFFLKVLGVMHPSKLEIDAVFHAHRLEWVMAGKYYFTQSMPAGVTFPYAIALYLFAAPWSYVTTDLVNLLRIVVCAVEALAGALIYPMVVSRWNDRLPAALAVAMYYMVPLPYDVLGNANLTNLFGQAAALVTLAAAVVWALAPHRPWQLAGLFLLCSIAFLSHVSTFSILLVTLVCAALFYRWLGGVQLRVVSWSLLAVTVAAAGFSIVTYYGHFTEVYATALRARTSATTTAASGARTGAGAGPGDAPARSAAAVARVRSFVDAFQEAVGWPLLALAGLGSWHLRARRSQDRLTAMICAWAGAALVFFLVAFMRVDPGFQRYVTEFVGRLALAVYPAIVILAALGTSWLWRSGRLTLRAGAALLVTVAASSAARQWAQWFT